MWKESAGPGTPMAAPATGSVRLFSWQLSYFSGKVRGYLRHKARTAGLVIDEVIATPEVIANVLMKGSRTNTVPQVQLADGRIVQDSTEIIDEVERLFPAESGVFFSASRSMPTANAEDPCRSQGTKRRVSPRPFRQHPPIRSSPRCSPSACAEKVVRK